MPSPPSVPARYLLQLLDHTRCFGGSPLPSVPTVVEAQAARINDGDAAGGGRGLEAPPAPAPSALEEGEVKESSTEAPVPDPKGEPGEPAESELR